MRIMKFGGSSVRDAKMIKAACSITAKAAADTEVAAVFSAMKGVTDLLITGALKAESGDRSYLENFQEIDKKHRAALRELLGDNADETEKAVGELLDELGNILHGIELVRECSPRSLDLAMSFGERLSCTLIAAYLNASGTKAELIDARECVVTDQRHGGAVVNFEATNAKTRRRVKEADGTPVVTGFIAATPGGVTTTLGRNGSDYTASIFGAALGAEAVEIWTDVDGVLSADPRYVDAAFVIDELSVEEAMELSFFGAEVIHPYTMIPAVEHDIPIWIKNTMNPKAVGTLIAKEAKRNEHPITGIASVENCSLVNVEGGGMMGVPGVASRVFNALAKAEVNIIMISQASSEHSICIVCRNREADAAAQALETELSWELAERKIHQVEVIRNLEIIAIIGENMRGKPGISGKLFNALGEADVNVLAIAQGSSERNISFVAHGEDRERALRAVHAVFLEKGVSE